MRQGRKNTVFVLCLLAVAFVLLGRVEAAEDQRKQLALHYFRGVVNFEAGRYEGALVEFQSVRSIDPYYKDTPQYIDRCMQRLEQARSDMLADAGLRDSEKEQVDIYFLGKSYYDKGDYEKAREAFKAVLARDPKDKFALYYLDLCDRAAPDRSRGSKRLSSVKKGDRVKDLQKEVAYIKDDIREQQELESFLASKAQRKVDRDALIRQKEKQLQQQESIIEEEKEDYLAEKKLARRAERLREETEKWRRMKEKIASKEPGVPATLTEFPVCLDKATRYYQQMHESLRASRWNAAGLDAIQASLTYGDAILIYFYGVKSAYPEHENLPRLLAESVKRSDIDENIFRLRNILNLKKLAERDDRPFTRSEALFLAENTEQFIEWCRSVLP